MLKSKYIIILLPLLLSAYSHLWNPLGFPSVHIDEGHYMRRSVMVLEGMGPQESAATGYPRTYDHPYFGQLFLAALLGTIGYPSSLSPTPDVQSIQLLHLAPRVLMGLLAVGDTFILYKIAERRYNTTVALIASILFAIMPATWIFRRVYLDTIFIPFILSSILFAIYLKRPPGSSDSMKLKSNYTISKNVFITISGIFLGLATYTKIPAITMIPLVATMIFFNSGKKYRSVAIWVIPVILLPLLWPLYSVVIGQNDLWMKWVIWQTERTESKNITFANAINNFFKIDPLITILGIAGIALSAIRKDYFLLLWIAPIFIFSYSIQWSQYFHLLPIFPAFCLGAAVLIEYTQRIIAKYSSNLLSYGMIIFVAVFGFVSTSMLITLNVNSSYYEIYATISKQLPTSSNQSNSNITLIGSHWWVWDSYWITHYVLNKPHYMLDPRFDPKFQEPIKTEKVLLVEDPKFNQSISRKINSENLMQIREVQNKSKEIATFVDNVTSYTRNTYPYNTLPIMISNEDHPIGKVVIKRNY